MSLIATLKSVETETKAQLRDPTKKQVIVDGSLSELITQALNHIYTKKDYYTGKPFTGEENPDVVTPMGADLPSNIYRPDQVRNPILKPTLESQQIEQATITSNIAAAIGADAMSKDDPERFNASAKDTLIVYALPDAFENGISTDIGAEIDSYIDSGAVRPEDFIIVHTGEKKGGMQEEYVVAEANQRVKDYEKKGLTIFPDVQSFINGFPSMWNKQT